MNVGHLCMGCMSDKGKAERCPVCGWSDENVPESSLYLEPGSILNGRYLLGRVLGHGGFGITYIAWDLNLHIRVAIKEYLPHNLAIRQSDICRVMAYSDAAQYHYKEGLIKFIKEARALARFNTYPGIVSVHNYFEENGTAYMVMEYLNGVTLKEYVQSRGGKICWEEAIQILYQVIDSLQEVHSNGMLHRDITPDNIKITQSGQVRLLDFGSARYALSQMTQTLTAIWTQGFAPEEQYCSKGKQGPWTDIYGVAATLYWAITGKIPPQALDRAHNDTLQSPSALGLKVPPPLEKVLLKALAIKAEKRYQTMREFGQALDASVHTGKIKTQHEPYPAQAKFRWIQQLSWRFVIILMIFLVGYWFYYQLAK